LFAFGCACMISVGVFSFVCSCLFLF
jgi:hypothetical protein